MQNNDQPQSVESTEATETAFNPSIPGVNQTASTNGVELVGKTADQKLAKPVEKKRSLFSRYLGIGNKKREDKDSQPDPNIPEQFLMRWSAPEFVQTHKPVGWYIGFGMFFIVLIAVALFTKQYLTVGLFVVMGVAVLIYANRPPRILQYQISNYGVYVGDKKYLFDSLDVYYETNDYGQTVLELVPNTRFGTLVSLPPAEHQLEQLEQTLGQMLPKVENRDNFVDTLFRKLRF